MIWTESTANYQWKGGGQLQITIPGVSGIKCSLEPGYLDGSGGGAGVVTPAGAVEPVAVPEPATSAMAAVAGVTVAVAAMRRRC